MKKYNTPEVEIVKIDAEDIITVSGATDGIIAETDKANATQFIFSDWKKEWQNKFSPDSL